MHSPAHFIPRRVSRSLAITGLLAISLGATSGSCSFGSSDDDDDGGNNGTPSFVTTLELRNPSGEVSDRFERFARIDMTLSVRNRLDRTVEVDFSTTRVSDFVVVRENSTDVVWKWSDGRAFADVETTLDFAPGETRTFTASWDQRGDNGNQVRSGAYEARGVLVYDGFDSNPLRSNQMGSTLMRFTID